MSAQGGRAPYQTNAAQFNTKPGFLVDLENGGVIVPRRNHVSKLTV